MDQGVPGSQNEHFFELLHPKAARGPSPPPASSSSSAASVDAAVEGSDPSPLHDPTPRYDFPPSYDFHLIHSTSGDVGAEAEDFRKRGSSLAAPGADHHHVFQGSLNNEARGLDHGKPMKGMDTYNEVTMAAIDHTMKNYMDDLLHVLQNVNERLSQLENRVQGLEHTIVGLRSTEVENHDQSKDRLLKLERLIEEVHTGVQLLQDQQQVDEAKFHLTKLYLDDQKAVIGGASQPSADGWQQPRLSREEGPHVAFPELAQQLAQHQPPPQYPPHAQSPYSHAPLPTPPQMQAFTTSQNVVPLSMNGSSKPPATQQPYPQLLPAQPSVQQQVPPPPPQHSVQGASFHSQTPPPPLPPPQSSYNLLMETVAYGHMQPQQYNPALPVPPSSTYPPEPPQYSGGGPRQQPLPPQEIHYPQQHNPVGSQNTYEGRMVPTPNSMVPSYMQPPPPKPAPQAPLYEATSSGGYGSALYRGGQPLPSAPSGGGGYPRLPTAQPLQHGLPAAAAVSSGPSKRTSLDEVIERVVGMGFSREQVRVVVRQLTESGQPVDMNVVLDKLMNGGDSSQPPRGWFNRA